MDICISVRGLVEFLQRSGDIDNRRTGGSDQAMQEGSRIHRMLQGRMGPDYSAEVMLKYAYDTGRYMILVEGRADGIITPKDGPVTVDEIKTTYRELERVRVPVPVHLAQAKVYAAIYAIQNDCKAMRIRMTYCNVETEDVKYFYSDYTAKELKQWLSALLEEYKKWADLEYEWKQIRQESLDKLEFPFSYREGQKELVSCVYRTIYHRKRLFIEAPTGAGKTIATVFPALKAVAKGMGDKIFYLTAKTIARTVAENTFSLLRRRGLQWKSLVLTAKEKTCFMEKTECNPEYCAYARGHYDRINDAVYDLLTHEQNFSREVLEAYAKKHRVCPFEFCLDVSLFSDSIICDYNYVFDPHAYLRRFFGDGVQGDYLFLADEAHNLLDRGREMYSAHLYKEDFLMLKKQVEKAVEMLRAPLEQSGFTKGRIRLFAPKLMKQLEKCNKELLVLKRECADCRVMSQSEITPFVQALMRLHSTMDEYLDEQDDIEVRKDILEYFFEISHFLDIYERVDDNYVVYTLPEEDGRFLIKLFCVNPSFNLRTCMERARSTILFSATLLPIQYYKKLLGGMPEDYEVYAKSVFDTERRGLLISNDVTSRYSRRSDTEYYNIARYVYEIVKNRHGNYLVFFPSYAFLNQVYEIFEAYFATGEMECLVQEEYMDEAGREEFLSRFAGNEACDIQSAVHMDIQIEEKDRFLLGFCVMGGIFGEGIDLTRDRLIGALIVGTGLPLVCPERELLKQYFDAQGENGFDYAYRFPGMNKVLQAAGRVIRTDRDVGIVALLDERFVQPSYQKLFPREWENYEMVSLSTVAKRVERFWDRWL